MLVDFLTLRHNPNVVILIRVKRVRLLFSFFSRLITKDLFSINLICSIKRVLPFQTCAPFNNGESCELFNDTYTQYFGLILVHI